jgi:hypothetical protein
MKHLKLFEGYLDQPQYWEIERDDFDDEIESDFILTGVEMDQIFIDRLKKFGFKLSEVRYDHGPLSVPPEGMTSMYKTHYKNRLKYHLLSFVSMGSYSSNKIEISIFQIEDEYFLVKAMVSGKVGEKTEYLYWKCDQFDGLIKFLKDKKLI